MYDFRPGRCGPRGLHRGEGEGAAQRGALLEWRLRDSAPCPSLDRIKREKGVWWMPWQQEAMKDVIPCDKFWGAGNRL
jgi:hypothetical protein